MLEILLVFLSAAGITLVLWCVGGLLLVPFFDDQSVLLCTITEDAPDLEKRVRAYAWLCGSGIIKGKMLLIGRRLTTSAEVRVICLCDKYDWLEYRVDSGLEEKVGDLHFFRDMV